MLYALLDALDVLPEDAFDDVSEDSRLLAVLLPLLDSEEMLMMVLNLGLRRVRG